MAMKAMKPLALIFFVVVLSCLAVMPATLGRTKADCGNLWKIVGGQGNSNGMVEAGCVSVFPLLINIVLINSHRTSPSDES